MVEGKGEEQQRYRWTGGRIMQDTGITGGGEMKLYGTNCIMAKRLGQGGREAG